MNRTVITTLTALLAASSCSMAFAAGSDNSPSVRTIKTQGEASLNVEPDIYRVVLTVSSRDKNSLQAFDEVEKITSNVLAMAKTYGCAPADIQTGTFAIGQHAAKFSSEYLSIGGFEVSREISFTVKDKLLIRKLIHDGIAAGATSVRRVSFDTSDLKKLKDAVRALALKAAKDQAEQIAGGLNLKVGRPLQIEEASTAGKNDGDAQKSSQGLGKVNVSSIVIATFEFE